ncbi:MAG: fumarylacetoacetate hydrolase family protein [Alphaproteobacteria bacterium]
MNVQPVNQAAAILWSAWTEGRRLLALPETCRPLTLDDGYAVQQAIAARLAGHAIGWKIAATSAEGQRHIGVTAPLAGPLFARFLVEPGATIAAGPLHMRVAEPEFAFRLGRDLAPRAKAFTVDAVLDAVDTLHLAIEVPDSRFEDFASAGAPRLVADCACAGLFVLGPAVPGWRNLDLAIQPVAIRRADGPAHEGAGANALGDPRIALAWLANHARERGIVLGAGTIVTTGTCAQPMAIAPGTKVTAEFSGLGSLSVRFS